ncbi:MAG: aminodeoxychorismate lyase [Gammaproteobacteria bacterium]|nr:aminodeoxychorismate lyase [Gammaproteobacteria bacterium]MCF6229791.1 aminodeoxychorismate lyase [Gammaproteobacteria bacterium]
MMMRVNGEATDRISALDRGFLYGDGLFETLAIVNGEPLQWPRHFARLDRSCQRLKITTPDDQQLLTELRELCAGKRQAVAKIIVTRGEGGRGYHPVASTSSWVTQCFPWPDFPADNSEKGVVVRVCDLRLAAQPLLAGMKHLNRLESVLARAEWHDNTIVEGLMRDTLGHYIEGTMSNLFVVRSGQLITDPLQQCGVAGIMRELIILLADSLGIGCSQQPINEQQLATADELFICNSVISIWPIRRVIECGDYSVGPVTQQLQRVVKESLKKS